MKEMQFMKTVTRMAGICGLFIIALAHPIRCQEVRTIFLVRHAEKLSDAYDSLLSPQGHRRAQCLANSLADAQVEQIFTSDLQRTQQTAAPLAMRLRLKPVIVPFGKPDNLVEAVRSAKSKNVLVVWHGGTLPRILHDLGGPEVMPIAESEYDRFFVLTIGRSNDHPDTRFTATRYCDCAK
jgi:phosphohistidine phosphatase SixA